jgi:hypothetical protein
LISDLLVVDASVDFIEESTTAYNNHRYTQKMPYWHDPVQNLLLALVVRDGLSELVATGLDVGKGLEFGGVRLKGRVVVERHLGHLDDSKPAVEGEIGDAVRTWRESGVSMKNCRSKERRDETYVTRSRAMYSEPLAFCALRRVSRTEWHRLTSFLYRSRTEEAGASPFQSW